MPKPNYIELSDHDIIPIVYEDRSVLAIDKPAWWMLIPYSWQKTNRNLQVALDSSITSGAFWARSRNLKYIRSIHRLDAETTGLLLLGKSQGAVDSLSRLFEERAMEKRYLAVVIGEPTEQEWTCDLPLGPNPDHIGKIKVDPQNGKDAETFFKVLASKDGKSLIECHPRTGRTHQIRVHLARSGYPIVGDTLYGKSDPMSEEFPMGLRSVFLGYRDPFTRRDVKVKAPTEEFLKAAGFPPPPRKVLPAAPSNNPANPGEAPKQSGGAPTEPKSPQKDKGSFRGPRK